MDTKTSHHIPQSSLFTPTPAQNCQSKSTSANLQRPNSPTHTNVPGENRDEESEREERRMVGGDGERGETKEIGREGTNGLKFSDVSVIVNIFISLQGPSPENISLCLWLRLRERDGGRKEGWEWGSEGGWEKEDSLWTIGVLWECCLFYVTSGFGAQSMSPTLASESDTVRVKGEKERERKRWWERERKIKRWREREREIDYNKKKKR